MIFEDLAQIIMKSEDNDLYVHIPFKAVEYAAICTCFENYKDERRKQYAGYQAFAYRCWTEESQSLFSVDKEHLIKDISTVLRASRKYYAERAIEIYDYMYAHGFPNTFCIIEMKRYDNDTDGDLFIVKRTRRYSDECILVPAEHLIMKEDHNV